MILFSNILDDLLAEHYIYTVASSGHVDQNYMVALGELFPYYLNQAFNGILLFCIQFRLPSPPFFI